MSNINLFENFFIKERVNRRDRPTQYIALIKSIEGVRLFLN